MGVNIDKETTATLRRLKAALGQWYGSDQISWDDVWLGLAELMAMRSRCVRDRVGAVMVTDDNRVVSSSYNGAPPTFTGDTGGLCREWCPRATATEPGVAGKPGYEDCFASHAETNAVKRAPHVERTVMTRLYVTRMPCYRCAVDIASARGTHGLFEVVVPSNREVVAQQGDLNRSVDFLARCDVRVRLI